MDDFYANGYRAKAPPDNIVKGKFIDSSFVVDFIKANWTPKDNRGKCLDIGSGEGCLAKTLASVHAAGGPKWDAYAVEPNSIYASYSREKMLVQTATEKFSERIWAGLDFRLITASHVIEHMHDFKVFLGTIKKRLRPEGALYIGTPAADLPWGESWGRPTDTVFETFGATHLQLFTSRTLVRALNDCGFWVDSLDHYIRGTLCLARHAKEGERNELAGKDDPKLLIENVQRGHEMWRQYISDPKRRHPFVQQAESSPSGSAATRPEVVAIPAPVEHGGEGNGKVEVPSLLPASFGHRA